MFQSPFKNEWKSHVRIQFCSLSFLLLLLFKIKMAMLFFSYSKYFFALSKIKHKIINHACCTPKFSLSFLKTFHKGSPMLKDSQGIDQTKSPSKQWDHKLGFLLRTLRNQPGWQNSLDPRFLAPPPSICRNLIYCQSASSSTRRGTYKPAWSLH